MFAYAKSEQKQTSKNTVQKKEIKKPIVKPNLTGIPDNTKLQFEKLSGFSFDDVRVHYNSNKPAQLQALAYTQGNQVYIASGQEQHLEHELGHIIQQKQGRVKATVNINGLSVNDNPRLENEAENFLAKQWDNVIDTDVQYKSTNEGVVQGLFIKIVDKVINPEAVIDLLSKDRDKWEALKHEHIYVIKFIHTYKKVLTFFDEEFCKCYFYDGTFLSDYGTFLQSDVEKESSVSVAKIEKEDLIPAKGTDLDALHLADIEQYKQGNNKKNRVVELDEATTYAYLAWGGCMLFQKDGEAYHLVRSAVSGKIADYEATTSKSGTVLRKVEYSQRAIKSVVTDGVSTCTCVIISDSEKNNVAIMHLDSFAGVPAGFILPGMIYAFVSKVRGDEEAKKVESLMDFGVREIKIFDRGMGTTLSTSGHDQIGVSFANGTPEMISKIGNEDVPKNFNNIYKSILLKRVTQDCKKYDNILISFSKELDKQNISKFVELKTKSYFSELYSSLMQKSSELKYKNVFGEKMRFVELWKRLVNIESNIFIIMKDKCTEDKRILWKQNIDAVMVEFDNQFNVLFTTYSEFLIRSCPLFPWVAKFTVPMQYDDLLKRIQILSTPIVIRSPIFTGFGIRREGNCEVRRDEEGDLSTNDEKTTASRVF